MFSLCSYCQLFKYFKHTKERSWRIGGFLLFLEGVFWVGRMSIHIVHLYNECLLLSTLILTSQSIWCHPTWFQGSSNDELPPKQKTDICTIMYTSGTTGEPKGVILTNAAIMAEVLSTDHLLLLTDRVVNNQTQIMISWSWMIL